MQSNNRDYLSIGSASFFIITKFYKNVKRISHSPGKQHTGCNPSQRGNQRARQGITRLFHLCGHKIHGHRIENGLCTPHHDGNQVAEEGVGAIFFEDVKRESGGGAGREHPYDGNGNKLCRKAYVLEEMPQNIGKHIQEAGSPKDSHGDHQPNQGGHDANHGMEARGGSFDESFIDILLCEQAIADDNK